MLARTFVILGTCVGLACSSRRPASATHTPSDQKGGPGSPELRTVDNAGFVDPAGRTHEVGAGTYGGAPSDFREGVPPPQREQPTTTTTTSKGKSDGGSAAPTAITPAPAPSDPTDFNGRAARALCDRETYCGRIGAGKSFESAEACLADKRERVRAAVRAAPCREIRGDRISSCLTAIRAVACGLPTDSVQPPPACTAPVLCHP
jgi:hypothetical protein